MRKQRFLNLLSKLPDNCYDSCFICISNLENALSKTWSDRFDKGLNPFIEKFNASIEFDICLLEEDLDGSIAHARMLGIQGIITKQEAIKLENGLQQIRKEASD